MSKISSKCYIISSAKYYQILTRKRFQIKARESYQDLSEEDQCVKSVPIRSFSGPYLIAFGLNTERYGVLLGIQSECGKIQTGKTPNTVTFHAVLQMFRGIVGIGMKHWVGNGLK